MKKRIIALVLATGLATSLMFAGCTFGNSDNKTGGTINICYQNGMAYAPFYIMQEMKIIEKYLPNVKVNWQQLGSGTAVSEGLASGQLDIGIMGVPPMLIAWDKAVDIKIFSGLNNSPMGLIVMEDKYKNLKNIKATDKIALPSPKSVQAIVLAMMAEKKLGKPMALENSLLEMAHPDSQNSLLNKIGVIGHFASPPYFYEEQDQGGKVAVDGFEAFGGDYSFLVTVATKKFMDGNPALAGAVYMAMSEAINLINTKDAATITAIAKKESISEEKVIKYLNWEGTNYTTTTYGLDGFAQFMKKVGFISKAPEKLSDYCWSTVTASVGQRAGEASVVEKAQER